MRILEFYKLRSAAHGGSETLGHLVNDIIRNHPEEGLENVVVSRHLEIESDLCVVLRWMDEASARQGRPLGKRLEEVLEELGLVDRSTWVVEEITMFGKNKEQWPCRKSL